MIVAVPAELLAEERRVALVPALIPTLIKKGLQVLVQSGAGQRAGYPDQVYSSHGAEVVEDRQQLLQRADIVLQVNTYGVSGLAVDLELLDSAKTLIGLMDPLMAGARVKELAATGVTAFALELMPRITRAQSMDVLSSMATVAGYKAVLLAAEHLPRMFPMLTTAAGTIKPARVFVIGAGVAGLQACATARRLGAVVQAFDVRAAVKEQVQSVGAKFVELPIETEQAEGKGGYAAEQSEDFLRRQRDMMAKVVANSDVVITTAAIPGKTAPLLVPADMVSAMEPGSVIVDLAAERGGNCELTRPGETTLHGGVTILGPLNLASTVPFHASQMYAKNISTFLLHLLGREGELKLDTTDEITRETLVAQKGQIVHERLQ